MTVLFQLRDVSLLTVFQVLGSSLAQLLNFIVGHFSKLDSPIYLNFLFSETGSMWTDLSF